MKKDYSIIAVAFCVLYWLARISMIKANMTFSTIGDLQTMDVIAAIITVISLNKYFSDKFLTRKQRKWLRISYPLIIVFSLFFEGIVSFFRKFDNAIDMCKYNEQCASNTIFYGKENEYIFFNKFYVVYYKLENNYWNSDYKEHYETYFYNDGNYGAYVYQLEDKKYFVSVNIAGDGKMDNVKDNTDSNFELLKLAYDPSYKIYNFYGKIINDFDNYEVKINDEKIEFKEKKHN